MFRRVADHLRIVRVRDVGGNIETIRTTDEHPFWVSGIGWVAARNLKGGQRLNEADDSGDAVVLSSIREEHPEGIAVYNFEVEGDHTYFVEDGFGQQTAVWVHNTCYRETFLEAHPDLRGKVRVHHSVEQNVLDRYPGLFTRAEIDQLSWLRGVPNEVNSKLHLSKIRRLWDALRDRVESGTEAATRERILQIRDMIDRRYGNGFRPPT